MKNTVIFTVISMFFLSVIIGFVYYQTSAARIDNVMQGTNDTVKVAWIQNFDYSSRVQPGDAYFNQTEFEKQVRENLSKNTDLPSSSQIKFTYLKDSTGNTKAVRVNIKDGDKSYQTTMIANVKKGDS